MAKKRVFLINSDKLLVHKKKDPPEGKPLFKRDSRCL